MREPFKTWLQSGAPWVWLNAAMVTVALMMVVGLLLFIAARGMGHFWPGSLLAFDYTEPDGQVTRVLGEVVDRETLTAARLKAIGVTPAPGKSAVKRVLMKVGNRDLTGNDFRWFTRTGSIRNRSYPADAMVLEREEWGSFFGFPVALKENGEAVSGARPLRTELQARLRRRHEIRDRITHIEKDRIGAINYAIEQLRLEERKLGLEKSPDAAARQRIGEERATLEADYGKLTEELGKLYTELERDALVMRTADSREVEIPLAKVIRAYQPNAMSIFGKLKRYASKLWEFVADDPREANTEGGIFPAIFGTVLMVMIMAVLVTPAGVIAAVYLSEYAKQGTFTRVVRIAVNNLAGVPSVVYGVFGLGFFVYFLGGNIDRLFYAEALPAPTFGTPGLLWSSLTLALLTVPVVIVATEEGLSRIPKSIREGSLALGATKAETLWRTVLPMATPGMMTGVILAIARAAGEVAPLMLVGVVKLAPSLPLDGNFPYLHLDRKFMHLGFHIYDVGFQSPNVEAARPLVYATALLLVVVIVILNLAAIRIRNRLREKYNAAES
ncbi:MAG: phosphate ABC transporter permease PstA [Chromatiales bacterium]